MKFRRQSRAAKAALKTRGIKPGKVTKTNKWGQASGGYSPFAASVGQADICGTCGMSGGGGTYAAFDRVAREWFTYNCPNC